MNLIQHFKELQGVDIDAATKAYKEKMKNEPLIKVTIEMGDEPPRVLTGYGLVMALDHNSGLIGQKAILFAALSCLLDSVNDAFGEGTAAMLVEELKAYNQARVM